MPRRSPELSTPVTCAICGGSSEQARRRDHGNHHDQLSCHGTSFARSDRIINDREVSAEAEDGLADTAAKYSPPFASCHLPAAWLSLDNVMPKSAAFSMIKFRA